MNELDRARNDKLIDALIDGIIAMPAEHHAEAYYHLESIRLAGIKKDVGVFTHITDSYAYGPAYRWFKDHGLEVGGLPEPDNRERT